MQPSQDQGVEGWSLAGGGVVYRGVVMLEEETPRIKEIRGLQSGSLFLVSIFFSFYLYLVDHGGTHL